LLNDGEQNGSAVRLVAILRAAGAGVQSGGTQRQPQAWFGSRRQSLWHWRRGGIGRRLPL